MPIGKEELRSLETKAYELRKLCVDTTVWAGSGHIGGALSSMDILTILYHKYLNIDPNNPNWEDRDRFILSKGHIGIGYAPVLADKGYFDKEWLKEYNHSFSNLGIHLDGNKVPGVDASTGSLGHGFPIALGIALGARVREKPYKTFCLIGDGECNEGSIWEAAMATSHYNATNLITFIDRNHYMIDGATEEIMGLEPFADKWRSFGFNVLEVNGHSFRELAEAIEIAYEDTSKPVVIIANTIKACGIDFMESDHGWHYGAIDSKMRNEAMDSLKKSFEQRMKEV